MQQHAMFNDTIPALYERYMVPLLFTPYAIDMARRLARHAPARILEVAAGTGAVTRHLLQEMPTAAIVATDLAPAMLEQARKSVVSPRVQWREADAMALPFPDASFDAVACQFGAMFFPDKTAAYAEARRVLRPGGVFCFNVWDGIAHNEISATINHAVAKVFPDDPPRFLPRIPFGYHDVEVIRKELAEAGFAAPVEHEVVRAYSRAASADIPVAALCQGTPLKADIEARDPARMEQVMQVAEAALRERFGIVEIVGQMQALVFTCRA